jgi:hypothetical protein
MIPPYRVPNKKLKIHYRQWVIKKSAKKKTLNDRILNKHHKLKALENKHHLGAELIARKGKNGESPSFRFVLFVQLFQLGEVHLTTQHKFRENPQPCPVPKESFLCIKFCF